jgi:hypothetical protein
MIVYMQKHTFTIDIDNESEPAKVKNFIIDKNIDDFHLSFQVIMQDGEARPDELIRQPNVLKKLNGKNAKGALEGFLNNYLKKMIRSQDNQPFQIVLTFIRKVTERSPLSKGKNGTFNCLLNIIKDHFKSLKDNKEQIINNLNDKYFADGVGEEAIDDICNQLKINIAVYSLSNEVWYEYFKDEKKKTFIVLDHDTHYTKFEPDVNLLEAKIKKIVYLHDVETAFLENKDPVKYPFVDNDKSVSAFITTDGTIYKRETIFYDQIDFDKNKDNLDLAKTLTLTARYTKEKTKQYNIERYWNDEKLFNFVKAADFHSKYWCTTPDYENGFMIDQNRAYMQYKQCQLYNHYQFPRQPTHFFKVVDQSYNNKILNLTGFIQISNVCVPPELEYLIRTFYLQNDAVYTSPELKFFSELGITFDIKSVAFSHSKQDIDFSIVPTEWQEDSPIFDQKRIENSIMGSLIMQSKDYVSAVACKDKLEFQQLRYDLKDKIVDIDFDKNIIKYVTETKKLIKGAFHIHAYILAYQQIQFLKKVLTIPFKNIMKIKVDAVISRIPFENFDHNLWHETETKKVQTPLISDIDFSRVKPEGGELICDDRLLESQFIEITGDAGTGKTFEATHFPVRDFCMLVPNNNLKIKFKKENPEMPCLTYHKAFQITVGKNKVNPMPPPKYKTYILDECSMICKGVMNRILTHPFALDANIIIIHDPAQLNPVMPSSKGWKDKFPYFRYGEEYKARNWFKIHLTEQKRQTDEELKRRLDLVRNMHCSDDKVELFKDRIISKEEVKSLYRYDTEDLVLASTNEVVDEWNKILSKGAPSLKVKYTRSTKKYAMNERLIGQKSIGNDQELAFASTIHLVQGLTFLDRIFLSQTSLDFDPHLFYTACSRAKTLDQIYLID